MKRRRFVKGLIAAPAAAMALESGVLEAQRGGRGGAPPPPEIDYTAPEMAADPVLRFFDEQQFAALERLAGILMPPMDGNPGAGDTDAPAFLDFLIGASGPERQQLYRDGLDALNYQARIQFGVRFDDIENDQAETLLASLGRTWSYRPSDPVERFLRSARNDIRTATLNSRQWAEATGNTRNTRFLLPL